MDILDIFIASLISFSMGVAAMQYWRFREKRIRVQIEELDNYESYIEKLSKGNVKLLRSSMALLFICLGLLFSSVAVLLIIWVAQPSQLLKYFLVLIPLVACSVSAGLCFYQYRAVIHSSDLRSAKKALSGKRETLESKIT
jgi:uncharacterized membrane protein YqjE